MLKVGIVQAHKLRAQQRLGVFHGKFAVGAIFHRHAQGTDGRVGGVDVLYLCNLIRVLARVERQTQGVDMRALEVSIGNAIVELQ